MRNPAEITYPWCIEDSTKAALKLADEMVLKKIAMPGMGTGVGEIPHKDAAKAMFKSIKKFKPKNLEELILVDTNEEMINAWNEHIN